MKHISWDGSTVIDTIGIILGQKTCKTLCGKRVIMKNIDFDHCDCQECINLYNEEIETVNKMIDEYPEHFGTIQKQSKKEIYVEKHYTMSPEERLMAAIFGEEIH